MFTFFDSSQEDPFAEHRKRIFFSEQNIGAESHWFFIQGFDALRQELYIPACSSYIIGIEASLRVVLHQLEKKGIEQDLDPVKTLSNRLLKKALDAKIPIESLAFPNEADFQAKILSNNKQVGNVEIVRIRHNLCHGNIMEYINTELGVENAFFTPECCRELAHNLDAISRAWVEALGEYRRQHINT